MLADCGRRFHAVASRIVAGSAAGRRQQATDDRFPIGVRCWIRLWFRKYPATASGESRKCSAVVRRDRAAHVGEQRAKPASAAWARSKRSRPVSPRSAVAVLDCQRPPIRGRLSHVDSLTVDRATALPEVRSSTQRAGNRHRKITVPDKECVGVQTTTSGWA